MLPVSEVKPYTHDLKAYLYWQWRGDRDLQAFIDSYNEKVEADIEEIKAFNLPNFYSKSGLFLDYVARNIYGMERKKLLYADNIIKHGLNIADPNVINPNGNAVLVNSSQRNMDDESFKKIIQWNVYKADGFVFSIPWLKRRLIRFLNINETNPIDINNVSILADHRKIKIRLLNYLANSPFKPLLKDVLANRIIDLPFMLDFELEE